MLEKGSDILRRLLYSIPGDRQAVCAIAQVEFHSALARRHRRGEIGATEAQLAEKSLLDKYSELIHWAVNEALLQTAVELLKRHDLRSLDALQLAAARLFSRYLLPGDRLLFIASDQRLLAAARSDGFTVWDPADPNSPTPPPVN